MPFFRIPRFPSSLSQTLQHRHILSFRHIPPLRPLNPASVRPLTTTPKPSLSIKALIKQYGSIAFLTYSLVSGISLTLWYTFIRLGLDVSRFTAILDTAKNAVFPSSPSSNILINEAEAVVLEVEARFLEAVGGVADGMLDAVEIVKERAYATDPPPLPKPNVAASAPEINKENPLSSFYATHGTTVLMAIAAHNVILPVRIGVTALLTPYVAARMRAWGWVRGVMNAARKVK